MFGSTQHVILCGILMLAYALRKPTFALLMTDPCCTRLLHTASSFGPLRPDEGIVGDVITSLPLDGCELSSVPFNGSVALVQRGECHFIMKVYNAQKRGASAVIVMNTPPEGGLDENDLLVTMASSEDSQFFLDSINISSIFITHQSGLKLTEPKFLNESRVPTVMINGTGEVISYQYLPDFATAFWSIMLFFFQVFITIWVFAICILSVSYAGSKYRQSWRKRAIQRLPRRSFDPSARTAFNNTSCVICIDEFESGDEVKTLPCNHDFHSECIDPWLNTKSNLCPICKQDAVEVTSTRTAAVTNLNVGGDAEFNLLEGGIHPIHREPPVYFRDGFLPFVTTSTLRMLKFALTLLAFALLNFVMFYLFTLIGKLINDNN